ncbi:hypothetical protein ACFJIW_24020 [Tahibacter sp. UC22_41]|uniref:hypothetical protein n=1 Tax=Tahibacter sp. UC22_41 TaxID=3350178 RepID=UPI0036DAA165
MNIVRSLVLLAGFSCATQDAVAISALRSETTRSHATATPEVPPQPLQVRTTVGWTYIYDGDGNRVKSVALNGRVTTTTYDAKREAALIAGEESGSAGGGALGGTIGGLCGPFAEVCIPAGAVAGGLAGDWIGGKTAAYGFDRASGLTEEETQRMYQDARTRIEQDRITIQENPSGF